VDEGGQQVGHFLHLFGLYSDAEDEMNDGLEDGVIELHDFFIAFGEDERVELVTAVDVAEFFIQLKLDSVGGTFTVDDYSSTCLNKILII
jgi:hypothetical protein